LEVFEGRTNSKKGVSKRRIAAQKKLEGERRECNVIVLFRVLSCTSQIYVRRKVGLQGGKLL